MVTFDSGPCGSPLMTHEQVPQMPSRQSLSKWTGSSPFLTRHSLSTSSISMNDMFGLAPSTGYSTKRPALCAFFWRHTRTVIFMAN